MKAVYWTIATLALLAIATAMGFEPHVEMSLEQKWLAQQGIELKYAEVRGMSKILMVVRHKSDAPIVARLQVMRPPHQGDPSDRLAPVAMADWVATRELVATFSVNTQHIATSSLILELDGKSSYILSLKTLVDDSRHKITAVELDRRTQGRKEKSNNQIQNIGTNAPNSDL